MSRWPAQTLQQVRLLYFCVIDFEVFRNPIVLNAVSGCVVIINVTSVHPFPLKQFKCDPFILVFMIYLRWIGGTMWWLFAQEVNFCCCVCAWLWSWWSLWMQYEIMMTVSFASSVHFLWKYRLLWRRFVCVSYHRIVNCRDDDMLLALDKYTACT